jgi:hypothetical protein
VTKVPWGPAAPFCSAIVVASLRAQLAMAPTNVMTSSLLHAMPSLPMRTLAV